MKKISIIICFLLLAYTCMADNNPIGTWSGTWYNGGLSENITLTLYQDYSVSGTFKQPLEPYGLPGTITVPLTGTYTYNTATGHLTFDLWGSVTVAGYPTQYYPNGYADGSCDNASGDYWLTSYYYEGGYWWLLDDNDPGTFNINRTSIPLKTTSPSPSNGATNQLSNVDLSWSNGGGACTFNVYFGTDSSPDSGEFRGNQPGKTYDPGTLSCNTTYYWRIDAKNSNGTKTGDVWYFTTSLCPVPVPGLSGKTQAQAESAVTSVGLTVGTVKNAYSYTMAAGKVCGQSPAAGTSVTVGSAVNYYISIGRTIYVDKSTGNDSRDYISQSEPLETVAKAIEIASDGDTIIITGGDYYVEDLRCSEQVTIRAQGGNVRIIGR